MKSAFLNFGLSALATTFVGAMCNVTVVIANGGRMPVIEDYCPYGFILDSRHICAGTSSKLSFLIDRFHFDNYIYSPGDFIISLGQVLAIAALLFLVRDLIGALKKRKT